MKEDGYVRVQVGRRGRWKSTVLARQVYFKSAWLGTTEMTHTAFDISAGAESVRIVMSAAMGTITGTAPAGEMMYVTNDDPSQGQRATQVDQTGRFTLPQVPPGKYRLGVADPGCPSPTRAARK